MSQHLSPRQIIVYTLPTIVMMLFSSVYDIVDGLFVSVYAGVTAFAALDLIMPYLLILGSLGFMVGAGANAVIANALSKGDDERANGLFSFFIYALFIFGLVVFCLAELALPEVAILFGAERGTELFDQCVLFGRLSLISLPAFMLQYAFQSLFATAGKPVIGMWIIVASGLLNVLCDCFFVAYLGMGVAGAGISTTIAEIFGGMVPVMYFFSPLNKSSLRLGKPKVDFPCLAGVCANGSSELMTNVATSVVAIFYNWQLMRYIGENGVAAYGVIMYAGMIVAAIVMGYSVGVAPLTSYQHGKGGQKEKLHIIQTSATFVAVINILMFFVAQGAANPLAEAFTGYDRELCDLTKHAFHIYSFAFLFMGFSMYASSLFTSLGSSVISGIISFGRTLVFSVGVVMVLPLILDADGIWLSVIVAEWLATCVSTFFTLGYADKYDYSPTIIIPFKLPGKLDSAVDEAVEALSDAVTDQAAVIEDAAQDAGESIGDIVDIMGDAIDDVREAIGDGVEGLGDALNTEGLDDFAEAIRGDDDTFDGLADMLRGDEEISAENHMEAEQEGEISLKKGKSFELQNLEVMDELGDAKRLTAKRKAKRLKRKEANKKKVTVANRRVEKHTATKRTSTMKMELRKNETMRLSVLASPEQQRAAKSADKSTDKIAGKTAGKKSKK